MWGNSVLKGGTGGTPHLWLSLGELENSSLLSPGVGGLGKEEVESTDCAGPTEGGGLSSDLTSLVVMLIENTMGCEARP